MKTGIVRRIDELGRVVIPKEIRRTMRLREGEEMEVYVAGEGELVLKKYSQIKNMREFCSEYLDLLYRHTGYNCAASDRNTFVASATEKDFFYDRYLTKNVESFLLKRRSGHFRAPETEAYLPEYGAKELLLTPILLRGDVIGGLFMFSKTAMTMPDTLMRHLEIAADFLSGQAE